VDHVWTCNCCGKQFDTLSFAYALDEPDPWRAVDEAERRYRAVLGTDTCVIDGKHFFVRGRVVIPVIGRTEPFIWGVWAAVSQDDFVRFGKLWDIEIREHESFPGLLANDIPIYPKTFNLKCNILMKNARKRPSFELEATDHPLAIEQRNGIALDRVKEIAAKVLRHSE
jgi:hypothetical protein